MRSFTDSSGGGLTALRMISPAEGARMEALARASRRAFADAAVPVVTVPKGLYQLRGDGPQDDGDIEVYWTGGINEGPVKIASFPASAFEVVARTGDGWRIGPRTAPVTDAKAHNRAAYIEMGRATRATLEGMNARARAIWPRP